ncbi:MAG: CRTAC1 family protein [Deltaproteobacteria bacterium]|nr:CRTAC1 family protein [Deltaproteobacteria bacterium]
MKPAENIWLEWAEWSLRTLDTTLTAASAGLDRLTDSPPANGRDPARDDRQVDDLTANLANETLRALRRDWWSSAGWEEATREITRCSAKATHEALESLSPAALLALPWRLPLSWASLATQEGLRSIPALQVVPPEGLADFLEFVVETFTDLDIYFTLRYQQELERWRQRVLRDPSDGRARLELGRSYLKCGLFEEAAAELRQVEGPSRRVRAKAAYLALVAGYRCGDLAGAFGQGIRCLELDPGNERARFWLFLTAQKAGAYSDAVPSNQRIQVRDGYHPTTVRFEEVAGEIGLDKVSGGRGTAVADFFGDGHLHVAVAGAHAGLGLYRNRGDGTFEDVSVGSGLEGCVYGFSLAAGDYDNDGRPDLFVSSLGFYDGRSLLFHNEGGGVFRDVTAEAGLGDWGPAFTATWVDTTGDGWLDLFVAHNLGGLFDRKIPNRLYRNNRNGTFSDVTLDAGLETIGPTIGACWGDFENRGLQDLFVSSLGRAQLFRNRGDGTFEDVSRHAGVDLPAIGSVALACDLDDNGWLDIVQTTYSRPLEAIHTLCQGKGPRNGSPTRIFRNNGDGTFTNVAAQWGLTGCWGTMSAAVGDFENSGRQGLFLGNGDPGMDRTEASVLLANEGRRLRNVTFEAGLPFTGKGHGVNMADLSGDGRLHLLVASGGLYPGDLSSTAVYRPIAKTGRHLGVRLVGTASNRDAIGARLALEVDGRRQRRLVSGGSGFGWAPLQQHFGLGDAETIGILEISWPSGKRESVAGLPLDSIVEITEGQSERWRRLR